MHSPCMLHMAFAPLAVGADYPLLGWWRQAFILLTQALQQVFLLLTRPGT